MADEERRWRMSLKKVLAEVSSAVLLVVVWITGCSVLADLDATLRTGWWETDAWGAWWVGPVVGAAYLVSLSERLGDDRPARILLRTAFVLGSAASGLAIQALREPRLTPRDFFLSYSPDAAGAPWITVWVLAVSALLFVFLLRMHVGITRGR